jgi:hypothetical protein
MNIDTLVESFYSNKDETESLINEVMDLMTSAGIPVSPGPLSEQAGKSGFSAAKFFDSIFVPNLSEKIGEVNNEAREDFRRSMKQVKGNSLREKIQGVELFMKGDPAMAEDASKVLSYLTFLKCMAQVFQDYSPSGSGFLLEAFLAGLLDGYQIVEVTDEEGNEVTGLPIADYKTGSGEPVSLKRLTGGESGTPIKGSIVNLTSHLINSPTKTLTYVIAAIFGEKESVSFYEFEITPENYIFWVGESISIDAEGMAQLKAAAGGEKLNEVSKERLVDVAKKYRQNVYAIQAAMGIPPQSDEAGREYFDGRDFPLLKPNKPLARKYFLEPKQRKERGQPAQPRLLAADAVKQVIAAATRLAKDFKKALKDMGPEAEEIVSSLQTLTPQTDFEEFYKRADELAKLFRAQVVAPTGRAFSRGPFNYGRMKDPEGLGKAGKLSALPDDLKKAFPTWMRSEAGAAQVMDLIKRNFSKKKAVSEGSLEEAKGDDKTQFQIKQARIIGNKDYFVGTVAVDRKSVLNTTREYNVVVKERLSPIFETLDRLMDRLQMFYSYNKIGAAEQASEQCMVLKTNVDEQIDFAKTTKKK